MSKTVLITGANSGFGRVAAETRAHAGHRVFASMRDIADRNGLHAKALLAKGIHVVELDVTDDASVERGVAEAFAQAERLDVPVNNAGIGSAGGFRSVPPGERSPALLGKFFGGPAVVPPVVPALLGPGGGPV